MNLRSLQADFKRTMLGEQSPALVELVHPAGTLLPAQSLGVYHRNMRGALVDALGAVYPVCAQLLGEKRFNGIAAGYVRLVPSWHSDLNEYGETFSDFLRLYCDEQTEKTAGDDDTRAHRLACLPELARLEWHYHRAYYAADDPRFDFGAFSQIKEHQHAGVVLTVSQAVALLSSQHPLYQIWQSREFADGNPGHCQYLCVHRERLRPAVTPLSRQKYCLLEALIQGQSLEQLARQFAHLDRHLPWLIEQGWVISFHLRSSAKMNDKADE